jgi:hypothetical protein
MLALKSQEMVRVALWNHGPELMLKDLFERFFLPALKFGMIQELFSVLVLLRNVKDKLWVNHDCSENERTTVFLDETFIRRQFQCGCPVFLGEKYQVGDVAFLNDQI